MVNSFTKISIALLGVVVGSSIWLGSAAYDHYILGLGSFQQCLVAAPDATMSARLAALISAIVVGIGGQFAANRVVAGRILKQLFDLSNDGLILLELETGNILECNQRTTKFLGYTKEELNELNLTDIHPHDYPVAKKFIERVERDGFGITDEISCRKKDGDLMPAEVSASTINRGGKEFILVCIRDISERVHAEEDRKVALEKADIANRAKSEFLATMSHELRTPLNAILGFSDILNHQYFGPPGVGKYREYAQDIHSSAEYLLELVNDLLDISAIEAGKTALDKQAFSIKEVIADCTRTVEKKAETKGIKLETTVAEDLPSLVADRRAIKQILLNLLSNAVKFTPRGGKVTVLANTLKGNTEIVIRDTGEGIPTDRLGEITDPFTKGENDAYHTDKGWGLGLAIAKSLVDLHEGVLEIKSRVKKGTVITVTLPNEA